MSGRNAQVRRVLRGGTRNRDALDADLVRVWAGNQEYGVHDRGHWRRTVSDLRELATAASERGIGVTVEKHEGTLTDDGEGARRLIEKVDEPNCGLNWQPLFGMTSDAIRAEVEELAPLSNNVHIQTVPESGATTRCALADAFFDVEHIVRTFQDADFDGYVNVEFVRDDIDFTRAIDADLDYLRSLAR
ncbi:sugar phosphate isomerase/epimerase [Haladaptatus sp. R4]|uniref:sugar phosphate isomerase/epimerase family protein n=1 Tax=Haladaptatus sp. R4 TaxID=1679489 RepID=UPI001CBB7B54|nr:TIM barrel protein [Haladaptatus sp. R4]